MMTRLTEDLIEDLPRRAARRNAEMLEQTGMDLKTLAFRAIGKDASDYDLGLYTAAAVPITSGLGIIGGFSLGVSSILESMGFRSSVTSETDVNGFFKALENGADIIFMADDRTYLAYNRRTGVYSNNSFGTAAGYAQALDGAAGGLRGKKVLVVGAGMVGTQAVKILTGKGAIVSVTDIVYEKSLNLAHTYGATALQNVSEAISSHIYILNASPGLIPGNLVSEGAIIASPGIPYAFDGEGESRAKTIIHDPLDIGTAVMAAECTASFGTASER